LVDDSIVNCDANYPSFAHKAIIIKGKALAYLSYFMKYRYICHNFAQVRERDWKGWDLSL
jgi:hypothetical protein